MPILKCKERVKIRINSYERKIKIVIDLNFMI